MSNFTLLAEWPDLYGMAALAESYARSDPRTASFHARRTLERLTAWKFEHDPEFTPRPYDTKLNALLRSDAYTRLVPANVQTHADLVRREGNAAVHTAREVRPEQATATLRDLWYVARWFAWAYRADDSTLLPESFDETLVPPAASDAARLSRQQLEVLEGRLQTEQAERDALRLQVASYQTELEAMRTQVGARMARSAGATPSMAGSEKETRERLIDVLLREAGWEPEGEHMREFPVTGMPGASGRGFVDYVLWGNDGLPLAVVEAKRTSVSPEDGRQQAKLYADALEARYGRRPVILYTNGIKTLLWDDAAFGAAGSYPPRPVAGFYTLDELELMIQRRRTRLPLAEQDLNQDIAGRPYQELAIRAYAEHLSKRHRRGLLVMATGTGKTRTAAAIVELLQRAGWVKRVLFLADRKALVDQTVKVFRKMLPGGVQNLVDSKENAQTARIVVSTYQTMLGLIESGQMDSGERTFGAGHFDLVIIDEAHRSVYRKYGAVFAYFDAYLLGLTATPRGEVDRNTYRLFELEDGVPLFSYDLAEAVRDGYLVPPRGQDATPRFLQRGIVYDDLSDEDKTEYDALEWDEVGGRREAIGSAEINDWLFNESTVDEVLGHLMVNGVRVQGGDVLGKTIVFAANHLHALFIVQRFERAYPHLHNFARVIDNYDRYAVTLIDDFSDPTKQPTIAVSIDMLDTGIDVPEIVNLVLFKPVRSKTKFTQMVGRGTRLSADLFGPGQDKAYFNVFDYCGNFAYFTFNPLGTETGVTEPVRVRVFRARLDLLRALAPRRDTDESARDLYASVADTLYARVQGIPLQNFLVRPHRDVVERYLDRARWDALGDLDLADLAGRVSPLPSSLDEGDEGARRFDELAVRLQLALLEGRPEATRLQARVQRLAVGLSHKAAVPDVARHAGLITRLADAETWAEMTPGGLETVRGRLRGLMGLIDREDRPVIYTNFQDEIVGSEIDAFPDLGGAVNRDQYRKKVEGYLRGHAGHPVVTRIRLAQPLSEGDLQELEGLLFGAADLDSREVFEQVYGQQDNLASFIRSLVGLDQGAAQAPFARFLDGQVFNTHQIRFVQNLISLLTRNGEVSPRALYDAPFTAAHPNGLDGLFREDDIEDLLRRLRRVNGATRPSLSGQGLDA